MSAAADTTTTTSSTARPTAGRRYTSITVVEPSREPKEQPPRKSKTSSSKKALRVLGNGLGVLCYMLCICCVLSGPQQPQAKKTKQGYYYQYDDDYNAELEGTRVRKVESNGSTSATESTAAKKAAR
jgi:hypothetical protein